jgi:hypothetical protein
MSEARRMYEQLKEFNPYYVRVLKLGTEFEAVDISTSQKLARRHRAALGSCFHNSLKLAEKYPARFAFYCGYATSVIPLVHAWNVERETNQVIDTTWVLSPSMMMRDKFRFGQGDYFGMELPAEFVRKNLELAYDFNLPAMYLIQKEESEL